MSAFLKAFGGAAKLFVSHRRLFFPFILAASLELLLLLLVWLAPQQPFSALLAPPIKYFSGSRVLHYPWHLQYLFRMVGNVHAVTSLLVGAYLSGIASIMVGQLHQSKPLSFRNALNGGQARYVRLLLVWTGTLLATMPLMHWVSGILVQSHISSAASMFLRFLLAVILQALFVYPIPIAVFEGCSWIKALARGLRETVRYPISTLGIVILPAALLVVFSWYVNDSRVAKWMMQSLPEIAIGCTLVRLIVVTLADAILTVSVAHLWWYHRAQASSNG